MKTIGMIGGMSWESSLEYYRIINQHIGSRLGGHHSAKLVLHSVDFAEIETCQRDGRWEDAGHILSAAARSVEAAGADLLILCTNTMHKLAAEIRAAVRIPFLHIAEATGRRIEERGMRAVGLLGTRYTMEQEFYKGALSNMGLEVLVPGEEERRMVHDVIYDELCFGKVLPASRERYRRCIAALADRGAEGVILGCTEIMLLVQPEDSPVPIFDTTRIHAVEAAEQSLL
jgi:aspartate racemase